MLNLSFEELHGHHLYTIGMACENDKMNELEQQIVLKLSKICTSKFSHITPQNLYHLTQMERKYIAGGKFAFDAIEPGYYLGVLQGWSFMLDCVLNNHELTPDLILKLHDSCVDGLRTEDYPDGVPLGFRTYQDGGEAFYLEKGQTVSKKGLKELNERYRKRKYTDSVGDDVYLFKGIMFNPKSTIQLNPSQKIDIHPNKQYKCSSSNDNLQKTIKSSTKSYFAITNVNTLPMIKLKPARTVSLRIIIQKLIDQFNVSDKSLSDIVELIQSLDQAHPFVDGNIRTFGMLLLNMLLLNQGFLPSVMDDVNRFDCLSINELTEYINEGQKYFQNIKPTSM